MREIGFIDMGRGKEIRVMMKRRALLALFVIVTLIFTPPCIIKDKLTAQQYETLEEGIVEIVEPVLINWSSQGVFTRKIDDLELKVVVPRYISLSAPYDKRPARLDIYLKMDKALSGLFSVDVEAGIGVSLPAPSIFLFLDIDVTLLVWFFPDAFRLKWPISGVPLQAMNLERGDVGVYALAVPVKEAVVELGSLTVNEWHHIGSYNLYVVGEEKLMALGVPAMSVVIGEVTSLETPVEVKVVPLASISKELGHYSYSNDWISIDVKSMSKDLYPGDTLTIKTRIEAKTDVHFNRLTLDVYGVKGVEGGRFSYLVESLVIVRDARLASGVLRVEDFKLTVPSDVLTGMLYAIISAEFTPLYKLSLGPQTLYDAFPLVYVNNRAYDQLQVEYYSLESRYNDLVNRYENLLKEYNEYKALHSYTNEEYNRLALERETLSNELGIAKALNYCLAAVLAVLAPMTTYLAIRRHKTGPSSKQ